MEYWHLTPLGAYVVPDGKDSRIHTITYIFDYYMRNDSERILVEGVFVMNLVVVEAVGGVGNGTSLASVTQGQAC